MKDTHIICNSDVSRATEYHNCSGRQWVSKREGHMDQEPHAGKGNRNETPHETHSFLRGRVYSADEPILRDHAARSGFATVGRRNSGPVVDSRAGRGLVLQI
jgi:hypothetical protein